MQFDVPLAIGKHTGQRERTFLFPVTQGLQRYRGRNRNAALARFGFRRPDHVARIGALANMQNCLFEIDILPAKAAKFRRAKPGPNGHQQERPPFALGEPLGWRQFHQGGIEISTPTFKRPLARRSGLAFLSALAVRLQRVRTTFWPTWPRSCASASSEPSDVVTRFIMSADRPRVLA